MNLQQWTSLYGDFYYRWFICHVCKSVIPHTLIYCDKCGMLLERFEGCRTTLSAKYPEYIVGAKRD